MLLELQIEQLTAENAELRAKYADQQAQLLRITKDWTAEMPMAELRSESTIQVQARSARSAGHCSACNGEETVIEITLGGSQSISVRVCLECAKILVEKIKDCIKSPTGGQ